MNALTKIYIRAYQKAFYIAYPFLPYREPQLVEGGTSGITSVLDDNNKKKPLVITDRGVIDYKLFEPLKSEFEKNSISYVLFDKVVPNPTTAVVEEALSLSTKRTTAMCSSQSVEDRVWILQRQLAHVLPIQKRASNR